MLFVTKQLNKPLSCIANKNALYINAQKNARLRILSFFIYVNALIPKTIDPSKKTSIERVTNMYIICVKYTPTPIFSQVSFVDFYTHTRDLNIERYANIGVGVYTAYSNKTNTQNKVVHRKRGAPFRGASFSVFLIKYHPIQNETSCEYP